MKDAQQDVIEELRRDLERSNKAGAATQRHMNLCRDITKCPDDETLAVWLEKRAEDLTAIKESIASDAEETNNLWAAAEYARKKLEKEPSTRVRLDDPVVKGLVEALAAHSNSMVRFNALAAYNARLKEVGCE